MGEVLSSFVQKICCEEASNQDLTTCCLLKCGILLQQLSSYTGKLLYFSKELESALPRPQEPEGILGGSNVLQHAMAQLGEKLKDDKVVSVIDRMLLESYEPPHDFFDLEEHIRIAAIAYFHLAAFFKTKPAMVVSPALLRLDLSTLKLANRASSFEARFEPAVKAERQKSGTQQGKQVQRDTNKRTVLAAYRKVGAIWRGTPEKPMIEVGGKEYTLSAFIDRHMLGPQGVQMSQRTITGHLKQLHIEGKI